MIDFVDSRPVISHPAGDRASYVTDYISDFQDLNP